MVGEAGLSRRLALGISGQAFFRIVTSVNSIALVPVFIHGWGVTAYGQWITLTALAAYLSYSNFGLVTTSSYEMIMASGAGDHARARRTFQMSLNLIIYVVGPVIALFTAVLCAIPSTSFLKISLLSPAQAHLILISIGSQIWLQTFRSQMASVLIASGRYAGSYYLAGLEKLLEIALIGTAVLVFHGNQVSAAALLTLCTSVDLLCVTAFAFRTADWARPNFLLLDLAWVRSHLRPTLGYLLGGLAAQGIMIQGPRLVLGALLGGTAVAVFSVYGTLMRTLDQLVLMLITPTGVEISRRVGAEDYQGAYRLIILGSRVSLLLFVLVAGGMLLFGPVVLDTWTRGHVHFDLQLMLLYVFLAGSAHLGKVGWYALTAANRLYGLSFGQLICALSGVIAGAYLVARLGLAGMVIGCGFGELANSILVIVVVSRWLKTPIIKMVSDMANMHALVVDVAVQAVRVRQWILARYFA